MFLKLINPAGDYLYINLAEVKSIYYRAEKHIIEIERQYDVIEIKDENKAKLTQLDQLLNQTSRQASFNADFKIKGTALEMPLDEMTDEGTPAEITEGEEDVEKDKGKEEETGDKDSNKGTGKARGKTK